MSEQETLDVIKNIYEKFNMVLDPHTAIGYGAFDKHDLKGNNIVLATAHPCKFPDAILKAINLKSDLPNFLYFIAAIARASPIASCVVVLDVGTISPDSFTSGTKILISEALYKVESFLDTMHISKILFLFAY